MWLLFKISPKEIKLNLKWFGQSVLVQRVLLVANAGQLQRGRGQYIGEKTGNRINFSTEIKEENNRFIIFAVNNYSFSNYDILDINASKNRNKNKKEVKELNNLLTGKYIYIKNSSSQTKEIIETSSKNNNNNKEGQIEIIYQSKNKKIMKNIIYILLILSIIFNIVLILKKPFMVSDKKEQTDPTLKDTTLDSGHGDEVYLNENIK